MEKQEAIQLISALSDLYGAPGFEQEVSYFIADWVKEHDLGKSDKDAMHNLYVEKKTNKVGLDEARPRLSEGGRVRVQLDAHMDEVAFMVRAILPNGTLRIVPLGGWVSSNIPAHAVKIRTNTGKYISGLTASKPPHFMTDEEKMKAVSVDEIVVDLGVSSRQEAIDLGIEVGAPIVPEVSSCYNADLDVIRGKAFDCRSGCAAILDTFTQLKDEELDCDVVAAFSTQEEVGVRGATVTSQRVKPDLAIVFEGCPADDTFGDSELSQTKLHQGPMLRHVDARMITHPGFQKYALDLAKEKQIPVQRAVRTGGSTNGAPIHLTERAVPTIVIGLPVRYIHTHYGYASYFDHQAAVKLAVSILKSMNYETYKQIVK